MVLVWGGFFLFISASSSMRVNIVNRCNDLLKYEKTCVTEMDRSVCVSGTGWTFADDRKRKQVWHVVDFDEGIVSLKSDDRIVDFKAESVEMLLQSLCTDFLDLGHFQIPTRRRLDTSTTEFHRSEAATVVALTTGLVIMALPLFWMFLLSAEVI